MSFQTQTPDSYPDHNAPTHTGLLQPLLLSEAERALLADEAQSGAADVVYLVEAEVDVSLFGMKDEMSRPRPPCVCMSCRVVSCVCVNLQTIDLPRQNGSHHHTHPHNRLHS